MNPANDFTFWYPLLKKIPGIRTPKTLIVYSDIELGLMVDIGKKPKGINKFLKRLKSALDEIGYPAFLRTGRTSDKHNWEKTCFITKKSNLIDHIYRLVEFSHIANIVGPPLPYDFWIVRKMIKTKPLFYAFSGKMPITREFRFFVKNGEVTCYHPYWPPGVFKRCETPDWKDKIKKANKLDKVEKKELMGLNSKIAKLFIGYWSVDWLQDEKGNWWCTDMALGEDSYHWKGCKNWTPPKQIFPPPKKKKSRRAKKEKLKIG